jgi:transcriptional regulator with XRE-family HTH domain
MIKNRKQLAIAEGQLRGLMASRDAADASEKAHWDAYTRLIDELVAQIDEFKDVRDGRSKVFVLGSLDDLGEAAIKARIARGWTHKDLGSALGISEQVVQRDESRDFENCGLARLAELLDVLGYEFEGRLRPKGETPTPHAGVSTSGDVLFGSTPLRKVEKALPGTQSDVFWPDLEATTDGWDKALRILKQTARARVSRLHVEGDPNAG